MSNTTTEQIKVTLSFEIVLQQACNGWWEAWSGKLGSTTAPTKEACIRIMKERAEQ